MTLTYLQQVRASILPILEAIDQEVVQPGLEAAAASMATCRRILDCPERETWICGTHCYAALHSGLRRFASRQVGWVRHTFNGVPLYDIGNGIELTVKRTPQCRVASNSSHQLAVEEFELLGHEQPSIFDGLGIHNIPLMHSVVIDYVSRNDGQCLTAMFQRRGRKTFVPLAHVMSQSALRIVPQAAANGSGPARPIIGIRVSKKARVE